MRQHISASFSYGGSSDYPGSSFGDELKFKSSGQELGASIEQFVDWVIESGAGVAAALVLTSLTPEVDPEGHFDYLLDQHMSFELKVDKSVLNQIRNSLSRSEAFSIADAVLAGKSSKELSTSFRKLAYRCLERENPGPLLTEKIKDYLT